MIVFFAVLGNANEWGEIESFAKRKEPWLRKYLELPYGIPTDDTYRIVMGNIDTTQFYQLTVHLLLRTIDGILKLAGKADGTYEKGTDINQEISRKIRQFSIFFKEAQIGAGCNNCL